MNVLVGYAIAHISTRANSHNAWQPRTPASDTSCKAGHPIVSLGGPTGWRTAPDGGVIDGAELRS